MEEKRLEWFKERFDELSNVEKLGLYNEYCIDVRNENDFSIFDEDFFNMYFEGNPYESARAVFYGSINWSDDYIRFNGYGNLESLSEHRLVEEAEIFVEKIYEWGKFENYIDMDEFELEEDDKYRIDGDI